MKDDHTKYTQSAQGIQFPDPFTVFCVQSQSPPVLAVSIYFTKFLKKENNYFYLIQTLFLSGNVV